jgi:hypothetical protein
MHQVATQSNRNSKKRMNEEQRTTLDSYDLLIENALEINKTQ